MFSYRTTVKIVFLCDKFPFLNSVHTWSVDSRSIERQTDRERDSQTDRQTARQTQRERETDR